jgi:hypothetical protein
MFYLKIANPGVCDWESLLVLGVSGSRGNSEKIGKFGSGNIHFLLTMLRHDIQPIIYVGNLKIELTHKLVEITGKQFRQAVANISGKTPDGRQIKRTQDLSYTLEFGELDFRDVNRGLIEVCSNALDGSVESGNTHNDIIISVEQTPRAKAGYTQVYIPYTDEVRKFYNNIGEYFLHFSDSGSKVEILPKKEPGPCKVYCKGVFVRNIGQNSVFDYNCNDLQINESRQSDEWEVRMAIANTLIKHPKNLAQVIRETATNPELVESTISQYSFCYGKDKVAEAYKLAFGDETILCDANTMGFVANKGYIPAQLSENFAAVLRTVERIKKDSDVLNKAETSGFEVKAPTKEMMNVLDSTWSFFECLGMTNGKLKPKLQGMTKLMNPGGSILFGQYCPTNETVFINDSVGGEQLRNTMVHEVGHHISGAGDNTPAFTDCFVTAVCKLI